MSVKIELPSTVIETRKVVKQAQRHISNLSKIEKENNQFNKLTAAERRIKIAQDVIKQVKQQRYIASTGNYFRMDLPEEAFGKELQPYLKDKLKCKVCALGACFASKVRLSDNFQIPAIESYADSQIALTTINSDVHDELRKLFSANQRTLIESAFEQVHMIHEDATVSSTMYIVQAAIDFGKRYGLPSLRLIKIMQNIIDNYGFFVPKPGLENKIHGFAAAKAKLSKKPSYKRKKK
jgi:hypothetical protein